jgi:hypothetical protein
MQPEGTFRDERLDVSFHGVLNKYFTGFGRYTWSRVESNQEGITWFPQNQLDPDDEWAKFELGPAQPAGDVRDFQPRERGQSGGGNLCQLGCARGRC